MPDYKEDGLTVKLPDERGVNLKRILKKALPGLNLDCMKYLWRNSGSRRLFLMEVSSPTASGGKVKNLSKLAKKLAEKVLNTLYVLASVRAGTDSGGKVSEKISEKFPTFSGSFSRITPIILISNPLKKGKKAKESPELMALADLINAEAGPFLDLFDVERITVIDPQRALKEEIPIEPVKG